jgi:XTP/dITP diphosphohydrolase
MIEIRFATTNPNKVREVRQVLADQPIRLLTLADTPGLPEPEETATTFEGNAQLKARHYAAHLPGLIVAEDSGLEIDALGGEPGVRSARYLGASTSYADRFIDLLQRLSLVPDERRTARFVCAVAVARGPRVVFETRGTIEGRIAHAPAGSGGFGYDPIFFAPALGLTLAQAGDDKAAVSHRGQAFRALAEWLRTAD